MHLQLMVRGILPQVKLWESMMQNHFFKWRRTNKKTGKKQEILVQGGLRQSVLGTYEFIFPKEALAEVLSILGLTKENNIGVETTFTHRTRLAVLRKILGVKKIPKSIFKKAMEIPYSVIINNRERGLSGMKVPGVSVHLIGFKEDKIIEMYDPELKATFYQEGL